MRAWAIQGNMVGRHDKAGPQGGGIAEEICFTLTKTDVHAVATGMGMNHANDNAPAVAARNSPANDNHKAQPLRFLSVCSGIEAASVAWPQWQAVAFSEIEKFPSAVLAHHYPDVPNLGDFTKIDTTKLGRVDILCGGTPCQAFSVAGLRRSLDDARGNLSLAFVELAHGLANGNGLRNAVWENVVGVLSTKDNAFGCFLAGLVGADAPIEPIGRWTNAGMVAGPKGRAAWRVFDAQYFGVAQRRRRVIVVADFGNGADPAAVLLVEEGLRRDTPPSRETGEGVAPTISARTKGGGGLGTDFDLDGGLIEAAHPLLAKANSSHDATKETYVPAIARCDATREGSSQDYESTTMVAVQTLDGSDVARTLSARHDGSPCVDRGPDAVVCFTAKDYGGDAAYDVAPTLRAGTHSSSHANAGVMPAVTVAIRGREGGATAELGGEVATALRASQGDGDKPHVLAFNHKMGAKAGGIGLAEEQAPTLSTNSDGHATLINSAVRRLTPVECERLQGFKDNYTAIPWRGKPASECPDGPRYKALGNSWAVPLFTWLGRRIDKHMPPLVANDNKQEAAIARAA